MGYYIDFGLENNELLRFGTEETQHTFLIRHPAKSIKSLYLISQGENACPGYSYFDSDEAGFDALYKMWKMVIKNSSIPPV